VLVPALLLPLCSCGDTKRTVQNGGSGEQPGSSPTIPDEPDPDPIGYVLEQEIFRFEHVVGESPCAQSIGTIRIRNTSNGTIKITLQGDTGPVVVKPHSLEVEPGTEGSFQIRFDCSQQTPFTQLLNFKLEFVDTPTLQSSVQVTVIGNVHF
jgi:hypothetical protein